MPILRQPEDAALAKEFSEEVTELVSMGFDEGSIAMVVSVFRRSEEKREIKRKSEAAARMKKLRQERAREVAPSPVKRYAFEEGVIRLNERDFNRWKSAYPYVGLQAELISLAPWAAKQGKNWFFAVSGALRKKNDKLALGFREAEVRGRYSGENPGSRVIMQGQG